MTMKMRWWLVEVGFETDPFRKILVERRLEVYIACAYRNHQLQERVTTTRLHSVAENFVIGYGAGYGKAARWKLSRRYRCVAALQRDSSR